MSEDQTTIMIGLLTEIREELRLQRNMIEKAQRPQAILPLPVTIVNAVTPQRSVPVPVMEDPPIDVTVRFADPPAHLDRRTLDELKRTLVHEIRGTADPL